MSEPSIGQSPSLGVELSPPARDRGLLGDASRVVGLGVLVFALCVGCLTLVHHAGRVTPLWPANAVVMACMLRTRARLWPAWLAAALAGNIAADVTVGDALSTAIGLSFSNGLEVAVAAGGLRRLAGHKIDLTRRMDLLAFVGVACMAAPLLSAAFTAGWLRFPQTRAGFESLSVWVMADALGAAVIGPVLLIISLKDLRELALPRSRTRSLLMLTLLATVMACVFGQSKIPLGVLVFPMLLLVTFRLEMTGAVLGLLITTLVCLGFALMGERGHNALLYAASTRRMLGLQIVLAVTTMSILPVASSLARARQLKRSLSASRDAAEAARLEGIEARRWAAMAEDVAGIGYFRLAAAYGGPGAWSDAVYRIHGLDPAQGLDLQASLEAIHPDDIDRIRQALDAARGRGERFSGEYRIRRPDGSWRTVSCRTISETDSEGRITGVIGALLDITDFKQLEAEALESGARYRLLADKASDVISRIDLEGGHIYVSPASTAMLGYTPEELIGRSAIAFVHPEDAVVIRDVLQCVHDGHAQDVSPVLYRFRHKDGHWVWLDTHPTVVCDAEGRPLEFIAVSRDVTRAKQAEDDLRAARAAAEAATQAKSEFLANMSHEIRTPLTAIIGFSGLLKGAQTLPESALRHVDRISTAGQSLLAVVNDILDFSKLEAGQVELDPHPFDPGAFVLETTQLLAIQAANKGLSLRAEIDGGELPARVLADSGRLRQVLLNLLGNAVKFTPAGSVLVRTAYDADLGLRIEVIDTGEGIPAERLDRLFQRFSQVDGSVSRLHGGTGLGLAICKNLVELMGGRIGVVSEEGQGSTFSFTIAAPIVDAAPASVDGEDAAFDDGEGRAARILVVDDLAVNRELVRAMLSPFGHDFEEAEGGAEAVQAALRGAFDLILMDLQMPGMDGFEAARTIRATAPLNRATPIIALSANVLPAHVDACRAAGMDDHLGKPIALTALVTKVAMWAGEQHVAAPAVERAGLGA